MGITNPGEKNLPDPKVATAVATSPEEKVVTAVTTSQGPQASKKFQKKSGPASSEDAPRKRGRPKGLPKTGGRQKGTKNWTAPEIRDELLSRSNAIETLADIAAGRQMLVGPSGSTGKAGWRYPSMQQRIRALEIVLSKILPDLRSVESVVDQTVRQDPTEERNPRDVARALLHMLAHGKAADDDSDAGHEATHVSNRVFAPSLDEESESDSFPSLGEPVSRQAGAAKQGSAPAAEIGERELVGESGAFIELRRTEAGGRELWAIYDSAGTGFGSAWSRAEARAKAEALANDRRI